ncbi:MAG: hypothetical protein HYZ18_02585, partial [Pseudogulbenkiania sp.]|nr:hypothetical protein [Pseudogulbenkiania sp.]
MSRISPNTLAQAITKVRAMDRKQKEGLADEIFRAQPHLLGSVLVQQRLGVSLEKMEFLIDILFICFQAMKDSGLTWPLINVKEPRSKASKGLTLSSHRNGWPASQAAAGMKPKRVSALIQRGALR